MHHRVWRALVASALLTNGLLLTGCMTAEQRAAAAAERTAENAARAAMMKVKDDPNADDVPMDSASVQRRRERIAALLDKNAGYGGAFSGPPKLINAKFAGPVQYAGILWEKGEIVYCASAQVIFNPNWPIPNIKRAVIRVKKTDNGEVMESRVYERSSPLECAKADYGPFPELELARARRRTALGKADS